MAQPAIFSEPTDPTLIARAQRYERDAVATLCDRNLDPLYRMCEALTADVAAAEGLASHALMKALDGLPGFEGDGAAFDVWLHRLATAAATRRRAEGSGTRGALARLSNVDFELVALRVLGGIDIDRLSPILSAQPATLRAWLVTALRELDGRSGTGWGPDLRSLDRAISELVAGSTPEQAATGVSAPVDAPKLLGVVADLRALLGESVPPATATRLRTTMLAAAAERRALWVHRNHGVATVPGIDGRHYPTRSGTLVALTAATFLAIVVGGVLAIFSSFAEPDSALYPLKRTGESMLLAANVNTLDHAQLEVKLAQTREREAEDMASRGDGARAAAALEERFRLLRDAGHDLAAVSVHDARWKAARDRLLQASDTSVAPIERNLQLTGNGSSATYVDRLASAYAADLKSIQVELGKPPTPPVPQGATPPPTVTAPP